MRLRGIILYGCLISGVATSAFAADSCKPIPSLARDLGPVFNQHCTSWCSIYVAADLLTQQMHKSGQLKASERIQPLSVAGSLFNQLGGDPSSVAARSRDFQGPREVAANLSQNKLCDEQELGADTSLQNNLFRSSKMKTAALLEASKNCTDRKQLDELNTQIHQVSLAAWQSLLEAKCSLKVPQTSFDNVFDEKRYNTLSKPNAPDDPQVAEKMGNEIDASLARRTVPAILLDIDSFIDPRHNALVDECHSLSGSGMHWASIVSRRRNSAGVCEYQLRSSWGASCKGFYNPPNCKKGSFWIPRKKLLEKIANVQAIRAVP